MDKRYQVFVSSTFKDLIEERQEIMQALLELDCIPAGMELFSAGNDDQWTLIKRVIDDCDYYIVVVGGKYGSIGPAGLSYTQMEYEYAVATGKPVIGFIHREPGSIAADKTEATPEGRKKLEQFRELVQKKMCKFWISPSDLGSVVSRSLVRLIKDEPAVGWVKANLVPDESATEEMLRLRMHVDRLEGELEAAKSSAGKDTQHLAQGQDSFDLTFDYKVQNNKTYAAATYAGEISTTWDEIFAWISPAMINEASDETLRESLNGFIYAYEKASQSHGEGFTLSRFRISENDLDTIKVQLLALNLIDRSPKKNRGVKDISNYWSLTPAGEKYMMTLRAVRRDDRPNESVAGDPAVGTPAPPPVA